MFQDSGAGLLSSEDNLKRIATMDQQFPAWVSWMNMTPEQKSQASAATWNPDTVVQDVFGDQPQYDPTTNTWKGPDQQKAYDRFNALNPPMHYPDIGGAVSATGSFFKNAGAILVGVVLLILFIKR